MSDYGIDIVETFGTSDLEVVLFPEDLGAAPVTLGTSPREPPKVRLQSSTSKKSFTSSALLMVAGLRSEALKT